MSYKKLYEEAGGLADLIRESSRTRKAPTKTRLSGLAARTYREQDISSPIPSKGSTTDMVSEAIAMLRNQNDMLRKELEEQEVLIPKEDIGYTSGKVDPKLAREVNKNAPLKDEDWLHYTNTKAIRNKPISEELKKAMSFLGDLGVVMEVFSGGQEAKGEGSKRTGSVRHDHGGAADVFFKTKDGRKLSWDNEEDAPILTSIVRTAKENGLTGFGAGDNYMQRDSMHIGFGKEAVWGAEGKGKNVHPLLRKAYYS